MIETAGAPSAALQPDPLQFSLGLILGFWTQRAIWAAARLRLADAVGDRPRSVDDLAQATGTHAGSLARLLNALVDAGVFRREADGRIAATPLTAFLRSEGPQSQRVLIETLLGGEHFAPWQAFEEALRTGKPAFDLHFGTTWVDYYRREPEAGARFAAALASVSRGVDQAIVAFHAFEPFSVAVDVGGSHGSLLANVLSRHPQARGIVFDLPQTVDDAAAHWSGLPEASRMQAVGGDFFQSVPAADLYLLKLVLHDWVDARAVAILRTIRNAVSANGRVAVIETVLTENGEPDLGHLMDLNMLVMTGGRERTLSEFQALFADAGFRFTRVTRTPAPVSVIEAVPA